MAEVTDRRPDPPACTHPGCGALAGDPWCYTPTRFRRHQHDVRVRAAQGQPAPAAKAEGSLTGRRPTHKQYDLIVAAEHNRGRFEVSGYGLHGEAQIRQAMTAMADPARGWFRYVEETRDGSLYELTDAGRAAADRYDTWMSGGHR